MIQQQILPPCFNMREKDPTQLGNRNILEELTIFLSSNNSLLHF